METIRVVTFGFWNTLYRDDAAVAGQRHGRRIAEVQRFLAVAGKKVSNERVGKALAAVRETIELLCRREHRSLSRAEIGRRIAGRLGFGISDREACVLAEAVSSAGRKHPPGPVDGAGVLLSRLAGRAGVGIICDTGLTLGIHLREIVSDHGLGEFVDHFTCSDETLTTKPAARQFLYTLHMLGVTPDQAVHVGGREESDVAGARAAEMRTIRLLDGPADSAADAVAHDLMEVADVLPRLGLEM